MKLQRAIIATDDNPLYKPYWRLVAKAWNNLGIRPTLAYLGKQKIDTRVGDVIRLEVPKQIPTGFAAQAVRLYLPTLFPDDVCITSDIDMLPLNGKYFSNAAAPVSNEKIIIYSSDAYPNQERFPICYLAAKGSTFEEIIGLSALKDDSFREFIDEWYSYNLGWNTDELIFGKKIHEWCGFEKRVVHFNRGWSPFAERRLDRGKWDFDKSLLTDNYYVDAHLPRPIWKHIRKILPLKLYVDCNNEGSLFEKELKNMNWFDFLRMALWYT